MAPPPGGPADGTPPLLIGTIPDSVRMLDGFDGWVEFTFDEIISEGTQPNFGTGNGELERLVMLSPAPDSVIPRVQWKRNRLLVRPRDGWLPNTVYRIELAPGIRDIREPSNVSQQASVITLATGGALPGRYLIGRAVDWGTQRPVPLALIEALLLPDSLPYRTLADSNGRFAFGPLPRGTFLVGAVVDQDRNRRRGPKESWDTVRVTAATDVVGEIWAFPRDSTPPRIQSAERVDSFTIGVVLTQTLDPRFALPADSIRVVQLPDSGTIGPLGALPQPAHDSLYRGRGGLTPVKAPDDTAAAKADSTPPDARPAAPPARRPVRGAPTAPPPDSVEQVRPPLTTRLMVRTAGVVQSATSYVVELHGVRTIGGGVATTLRIRVEGRKPVPSKADSLAATKDSTAKARPDSTSGRPTRR
ncbi:MAG: hypothetical protein IPO52_11375 [Gemmatimonadetes bacterium]|nr:hypothetical protein [Gemmatimonadota bacterium]